MTAATISEFSRLAVFPGGPWLAQVGKPFHYQFGVAYGTLELTYHREQAKIYGPEAAAEIHHNLARIYPEIQLDHATFEEWVLQEAG